MFQQGNFVLRFLGALILIGALAGGGFMLFRAGQAQGYALGLASAGKELSAPGAAPANPPVPYYGYGYYHPFFMPFFAPFGLFGFGLPLLFFFLIVGGISRLFFWRRHAMWHAGYGPRGPHPWGGPASPEQAGEPKAEQAPTAESK